METWHAAVAEDVADSFQVGPLAKRTGMPTLTDAHLEH